MERVRKFPHALLGAISASVFLFAAGGGKSAHAAELPPPAPGAFTITPTNTLHSFHEQVDSSSIVRKRFASYYHISPSRVPKKFAGITVGQLSEDEPVREYFISISGAIKSHKKVLAAGSYVAFGKDGQPILHWRCGNPIVLLKPYAVEAPPPPPPAPAPMVAQAPPPPPPPPVVTPPAPAPVVVPPPPPPVVVPPPPPPAPVVVAPPPPPVVVAPPPPAPVAIAPTPTEQIEPWSIGGEVLESSNAIAKHDSHQIQYGVGVDYAFLQPHTFIGLQPSIYGDFHGVARDGGHVDTYAGGLALRTVSKYHTWSPYIGAGVGLYGGSVRDNFGGKYVDRIGGKVFVGLDTPYGLFLQVFYDGAGDIRKAHTGGPGLELGIRF